ncbi:MAG TPA: hypothetical protein VK025_03845 [Steroidobacter sp.]|nr:hypothetical protein [Steroidobacter sp.]
MDAHRIRIGGLSLAPLLALVGLAPVHAADEPLAERIAACTSEKDEVRRLACFDRAAQPLAAPRAAALNDHSSDGAHVEPPVRADAPAQDAEAVAEFGVKGSAIARERDVRAQDSPPDRISAVITKIERRPRGELVFALDNGQVWAQKRAQSYYPAKTGDSATILAGALGSHRLIVGGRATAVTRIK